MAELILTNGDSAAELLRQAGRVATIVPWRDVLHEGPIAAETLEAISAERVSYLARRFRIDPKEIEEEFAERNALMRMHSDFENIELWFEHDLYDQLQLIQILAFFAEVKRTDGLALVQADNFLGAQRPDTILRFAEQARPITQADIDLAAGVWADLAALTPERVAARVETLDARLPFLKSSLRRFLEELPAPGSGVGRTEQAILVQISEGTTAPVRLFHEVIMQEEAAFMGDWSFFHILDDLASCDVPLIAGLAPSAAGETDSERFQDAELELTMAGEDVLSGEDDHVAMSALDRWWAGTRLLGREVWRYDRGAGKLVAPDRPEG
jgi:Domain of unknown function (DUF1835)